MMPFRPYMHVERLGSDEVEGLTDGTCYIFPKIDGTNASVWANEKGYARAGSRTREVTLEQDNAGFCAWVIDNASVFEHFFALYPSLRLYGEWLVPHTLKTYRAEAWRELYIFDVYDDDAGRYLSYEEYTALDRLAFLPLIAPIEIVTYPTAEHLYSLLDRNTYLIDDGQGVGEGIVIKRYDFVNRWGRTAWGKIVRNQFKEHNQKAFGIPTVQMAGELEQKLAAEYATHGRVTKTLEKMRENGPVTTQRIPELLNRVWYDIIQEETWDILKRMKNPTINFRYFYRAVTEQTKQNCPELFG
jgi:hypothetical protein